MRNVSFTMTDESITVVWKGKPITVKEGAANFLPLKRALIAKDWDNVEQHLRIPSSIEAWTQGHFSVENDTVHYKGEPIPEDLNERMLKMAAAGEDPTPFMRFFERLQKNPSWRSVQQLFAFLKHEGIPFTKDGCFLAYKGVRGDYLDAHSATLDNRPGNIHEMPRNKISDDPNEACHYGLHVGALQYARGFSNRVVMVKVAPEDVVCVPYDSSQHKMRVCKYKVISDNPTGEFVKGIVVDLKDEPKDIYNGYQKTKEEPEDIKTEPAKKPQKKPVKPSKLDQLDKKGLLEQPIGDLRKYASTALNVKGAYKLPGGKEALVRRIIQVRRKYKK